MLIQEKGLRALLLFAAIGVLVDKSDQLEGLRIFLFAHEENK